MPSSRSTFCFSSKTSSSSTSSPSISLALRSSSCSSKLPSMASFRGVSIASLSKLKRVSFKILGTNSLRSSFWLASSNLCFILISACLFSSAFAFRCLCLPWIIKAALFISAPSAVAKNLFWFTFCFAFLILWRFWIIMAALFISSESSISTTSSSVSTRPRATACWLSFRCSLLGLTTGDFRPSKIFCLSARMATIMSSFVSRAWTILCAMSGVRPCKNSLMSTSSSPFLSSSFRNFFTDASLWLRPMCLRADVTSLLVKVPLASTSNRSKAA
mmetsp:Transcript_9664/g.17555  ORF Transcript_9664/g.17555 Transcript_9664/m.17555 type:complete len:274 (-) Transcript_9664:1664-2485(-)